MSSLAEYRSRSMVYRFLFSQTRDVCPKYILGLMIVATVSSEPVPDLTPDALAQSFLQTSIHDHSDSVLLDTLSESIHSTEELGLGPAQEEGMFTTVLAAFMDALKSRLAIEIED